MNMRSARLNIIMNKVMESHDVEELQSNESKNDIKDDINETDLLESTRIVQPDDSDKRTAEDNFLDACEYSSTPERLTNKSLSSLSADSDYLAKATQDISKTPSTISNISFVLNQTDFIASPTAIFENINIAKPYHDDVENIRGTPSTSRLNETVNLEKSRKPCRKIRKQSIKRSLDYSSDHDNDINAQINFDFDETLTPGKNSDSIIENCSVVGNENRTLTSKSNSTLEKSNLIIQPNNNEINDQINSFPSENVQEFERIAATAENEDSSTNIIDKPKQLTRKRGRHETQDKKSKTLKNKGKAYIGCRSKKIFHKKTLKPECKCKKKCGDKITHEQREAIMQKYYELGDHERQWRFIANLIQAEDVKRITTVRKNNRTQSIKYFFLIETKKVQVCKVFFINTLSISHQIVYTALEKTKAGCESSVDMRGRHDNRPHKMNIETAENIIKHINLFPKIESHYIRKDSTRQYLSEHLNISKMYRLYKTWFENGSNNCTMASKRQYETIFNTKFNYSFFKPKKDQCSICTLYEQADPIRKIELQEKFDRHQKNKLRVRQIKKAEKESVDQNNSTIAIFDLEKVLSIPQSQVGIFHYKRKYPIYNFTVFDASRNKGYCYVWHYQIAKRGAIEIASCLWLFLLSEKERGIKNIFFYSDGCGGQNKNRFIFSFYLYAAQTLQINITHKFFETGHGQSEADSMHSRIEGELKNRVVYTPEQMYSIIINAKVNGEPYVVKEMSQKDFYDIKELIINKNWIRDENGQKILWSKVMQVHVSYTTPLVLHFKYNFDDEYTLMNTTANQRVLARSKRNVRQASISSPAEQPLKLAYTQPLPVSKALHNDLISLCKSGAIPPFYHGFYDSLTAVEGPECNENEEDQEDFE
ncbi:hypothetical protein ACJJTC_005509 [Scirpophaga incertulas]